MSNRTIAKWAKLSLCAALWASTGAAIWKNSNPSPEPALPEVSKSDLIVRDGKFYPRTGTNLFTGFVTEHYPDGSLQSRSKIVHGLLNGPSAGWHSNGKLQVREHFANGVSHGERMKWHENGVTLSRAHIEHGKIQGQFRRWHENGIIAERIPMVDGAPEGIAEVYYPSGLIKAKVTMRAGQSIARETFKDEVGHQTQTTIASATAAAY